MGVKGEKWGQIEGKERQRRGKARGASGREGNIAQGKQNGGEREGR